MRARRAPDPVPNPARGLITGRLWAVALTALLLAFLGAPARSQTSGAQTNRPAAAGQGDRDGWGTGDNPARNYFTDVVLVDQNGRERRLYSDLLEGKVVVISAFFTTCDGACPLLGKNLAAVQEWLGDRLGDDVHLISITVDPETDTPPRLKAWGKRFGARPGWTLLTGDKANVDLALRRLGQYVEQPEAHQNLIIIGNEPTGLWKKAFGLSPAKDLIPVVRSVLGDEGAAEAGGR